MSSQFISTSLDALRGMIVGACLGDALGAPHEFLGSKRSVGKYTGKLEYVTVYTNARFKIRHELSVGQVTDDSEMTKILLSSILENGEYNESDVITRYLSWANSGHWMMGRNTRTLFKGIKTIKGYKARLSKIEDKDSLQSNGFMMRSSSLAVFKSDECCIDDCNLTNPNDTCRVVNTIYIRLLRRILEGEKDRSYLYDMMIEDSKELGIKSITKLLSSIDDRRDVVSNKGWCLHALWFIAAILNTDYNYSQAMKYIIKKGGDTDTNACIVGAILGALHGYDELYDMEGDNIEIMLSVDYENSPTSRSSEYAITDVLELVDALYDRMNE